MFSVTYGSDTWTRETERGAIGLAENLAVRHHTDLMVMRDGEPFALVKYTGNGRVKVTVRVGLPETRQEGREEIVPACANE